MSEKLHTYKLADGSHPIRNDDGCLIALVSASAYEQRAAEEVAEIAHRWNSYLAMLEALQSLLEMPAAVVSDDDIVENKRRREIARFALAQARGEGGKE